MINTSKSLVRASIFAAAAAVIVSTSASALTYQVLIENQIPGGAATGQPFSPPVLAVHDATYMMWDAGDYASPGIIQVAEEGNPTVLEAEAMAAPGVHSVMVGTGPFFDSQTVMISGDPGQLLSMAWMIGRTNDLFSGVHNIPLPSSGSLEFITTVYDAGSEVNTGMIEDLGFYGHPNTGPDEHNPVSVISSYTIHNDPTYGELMWDFPPAGRVVIQAVDSTPVEHSSWGAIKSLYR